MLIFKWIDNFLFKIIYLLNERILTLTAELVLSINEQATNAFRTRSRGTKQAVGAALPVERVTDFNDNEH
jgi:hypothetical protein